MSAEHWQRISELFDQAVDRDPAARASLLESLDPMLRAELEALLAADGHAGPRLAAAIREGEALFTAPPIQRFGPYRVTRLIGQGGMGAVYEAARDDQTFDKRVAVKVLHFGMDTPETQRRFRQERQILARLEHPNIARLIDGGETETGRSYIVMEYVEGQSILEYCAGRALSRNDRLRLFVRVCAAVEYAHQNLVVHRDLKPENILVTADGEPKLLDFGIAKVLDHESRRTMTALQALTPSYASPEQVSGGAITAASDVYSLGVILYRLLSGRLPYDIKSLTPVGIQKAVCETPPAPSGLSRDLDSILRMALRKEPSRRYTSAAQLAEDIERALAQRPVLARPETMSYRAAKFARRHALALGAACVLAMALAGGAAINRRAARLAERRLQEGRQFATRYLTEFENAVMNGSSTVMSRELAAKTALDYLDRLVAEAGGDQGLLLDLATAYEKLGDAQGRSGFSRGLSDAALASYTKSSALAERVLRQHPGDLQAARFVAEVLNRIAEMHLLSRHPGLQALDALQRSAAITARAVAAHPDDILLRFLQANTWMLTGDVQSRNRDYPAAQAEYERSREGYRRAAAIQPQAYLDRAMVMAVSRIGQLHLQMGRPAEALPAFRDEAALRRRVADRSPGNVIHELALAISLESLGTALGSCDSVSMGDWAGAEEAFGRMLSICEKASAADPTDYWAHFRLISAERYLGDAAAPSNPARAVALFRRALESAAPIENPSSHVELQNELALAEAGWGRVELARGRPVAAIAHLRAALDRLTTTQQLYPESVIRAQTRLGEALHASRRSGEARRALHIARALAESRPPEKRNLADVSDLAALYEWLAKTSPAEACAWSSRENEAWQEWRRRNGPMDVMRPDARGRPRPPAAILQPCRK